MHKLFTKINLENFFLGIILFTLPFSNSFNSKIIIVSSLFFLFKNIKEKTFKNLKYYWASFMFIAIQFVSFLPSTNFYEANKKLILFLPFIVFPFLFSSLKKSEIKLYSLFNYLLYGVLIILIYGGIKVFYDIVFLNERHDYGRGIALLLKYVPHHVYLSLLILISILSICFGVVKNEIKRYNLIFLPILYTLLFFLGSRMALFISVIVLPFILFNQLIKIYSTKKVLTILSILFISFVIIGLSNDFTRDKIFFTFYEIFGISTDRKPFNGINFRGQIWASAIELIKEAPLFGYGIGDAQYALNVKYISKSYYEILGMNAHNQFLQFIIYYGIIFSLLLFTIVVYYFRVVFIKKNYFLVFTWLILIAFCLSESILNRHLGVIIFAYILNISINEGYNIKKSI